MVAQLRKQVVEQSMEEEEHEQEHHSPLPNIGTDRNRVHPLPCIQGNEAEHEYGTVSWEKTSEGWSLSKVNYEVMTAEPSNAKSKDPESNMPGPGESRQPLSRKVRLASSLVNPYRMIIVLRLISIAFYLRYRVLNPVLDAYWLWLTSVVCEFFFALSWLVDQVLKWFPVRRETYLDRLASRYEKEDQPDLPAIDVLINAEDPSKQPVLGTANTILSVLAIDYPIQKLTCYVSDDSAAMLTFEGLSETSEFARKWVPFCKRFNIEPRAPEIYFGQKIDYSGGNCQPLFVKERRAMKREYEEFKVRINGLVEIAGKVSDEGWNMEDGTPWPGTNNADHPGIIQVFLGQSGGHDSDSNPLPCLVYVSRERRPGFKHYNKAGAMNAMVRVSALLTNAPYIVDMNCGDYVNNSGVMREAMCFMIDAMSGSKACFVQFPQRFPGVERHDILFDSKLKGLDGIQGPIYVGRGCFFRRQALYGLSAPGSHKTAGGNEQRLEKRYGQSLLFVTSIYAAPCSSDSNAAPSSLLKEAIHVISCGYEDKTEWGKEVGWIYGGGDAMTGFVMHARGWRSIYCMPQFPAFKTYRELDMAGNLEQLLAQAVERMDLLLSKHNPLWYSFGSRLKWLQRFAYLSDAFYPLISLPFGAYCLLPAVCLVTGKFIIPELGEGTSLLLMAVVLCIAVSSTLEMRWSGLNLEDWWRDEQLWVIGGVSSQLVGVFQGLVKFGGGEDFACGVPRHLLQSCLVIPPLTILLINVIGVAAGLFDSLSNGNATWGVSLGKFLFAFWVISHLFPVLKAIMARRNRTPTIVAVWSVLLASIFSLLWVRVNPFMPKLVGPSLEECGINC